MIQLEAKESPVTVACDNSAPGKYRYIYVRVDEIQRSQIEALECLDLNM